MKIFDIKNLNRKLAQKMAIKKLKTAGIRKSKRVIKAEYMDFCEKQKRSEADRLGFLSVMKYIANNDAKKWIEKERARLIKKRILKSNESEKTKEALLEELRRGEIE